MKKLNFEQMEGLQGGYKPDGWTWSIEQHILCIASGILVGGGAGGAAAYVLCLGLIASSGYVVATPTLPQQLQLVDSYYK
jgi:hypothetical protein